MKRLIGSLTLVVAASFVTPLHAQQHLDVPSFVALAARGTTTATACANTANSIVALKVPADHAAARSSSAANAMSPNTLPLPISEENAAFLRQIQVYQTLLASCGQQLTSVRGPIRDGAARFATMYDKIPKADAQKVATALNAYNEASKKLVTAILALSNDKQVESHMTDVIVKEFINPNGGH